MTRKILCVAGARPNFVKIGPIVKALAACESLLTKLIHTGHHYDAMMSAVFFDDLNIPRPDVELAVGSGSHAAQTAEILQRFGRVLEVEQPHAVVVVGDVNSTIACGLATAKFHLDVPFPSALGARSRPVLIHVEAGLRSFESDMPEEVNRRLTDGISDVLFVSEAAGMTNLASEGVSLERCFFVGNVMIDALLGVKERALRSTLQSDALRALSTEGRPYGLVTLHRPSNVDRLSDLLTTLDEIAHSLPLVFPVHPRTREKIDAACLTGRWILTEPLGYLEMVKVMANAAVVLTDSGGVQEETTVLGVPCLTLRENTERPATIENGTNELVGTKRGVILAGFARAMARPTGVPTRVPPLWDGKTALRIAKVVEGVFTKPSVAALRSA